MPVAWNANELFNELLSKAEQRFGARSRTVRIKVLARNKQTPESVADGSDGCIVYYFQETEKDYQRLRFQLAHEAVHVLSGAFVREARKLEEGLAVWFSLSVINRSYRKRAERGDGVSSLFLDALKWFTKLKATDDRIRAFREKCPNLDFATPELIAKVFRVDMPLASELCQRVPADMHLR